MSICSNDTKKKTPEPNTNEIELTFTPEGEEALQEGDVAAAQQAGVNPMAIPDLFNNIRNNYYVANRIIWLTGDIDWPIVTEVMKRLCFYEDGSKDPIYIYISSPGGLCDAGWALIDLIEKIKSKGIPVYTICAGSCSSMAAVILAAGSDGCRYAFPSSRIMIHQAGYGFNGGGKLDEVANEVRELQYWTDLTAKYFAKRTKKSLKEVQKALTYDNYMSAAEGKKFGLVDKVGVVLA